MARFCENCGAPLPEGVRFCGECGTPVQAAAAPAETPAVPEAPGSDAVPAFLTEAPAQPAQAAVAAPPRPKKPRPKWVVPVVIAVAVVAAAAAAAVYILGRLHRPEAAMDSFLDALSAGDAAALANAAVCEDADVALTEENTAPLFRLYSENDGFVRALENQLEQELERIEDDEEPNEDQLFHIEGEKRFLHTAYHVVIGTCEAEIYSELDCGVALDSGEQVRMVRDDDYYPASSAYELAAPDCDLVYNTHGTVHGLLPGRYTASGSASTSFGATFTASADLELLSRRDNKVWLSFDYSAMEIYNDNNMDIELYLGDTLYGVVPARSWYYISPIQPDTQLEARADVGQDAPMSMTYSAAEGSSWNVSFALCELEIENDYGMPVTVLRGGETLQTIDGTTTATIANLPQGTELALVLVEGVTEPVQIVCEDTYSFERPSFVLTAEQEAALDAAAEAYMTAVVAAFNAHDLSALGDTAAGALKETNLRQQMYDALLQSDSFTIDADGFTAQTTMQLEPCRRYGDTMLAVDRDGVLRAETMYQTDAVLTMAATYEDGATENINEENTLTSQFTMEYVGGTWEIMEAE